MLADAELRWLSPVFDHLYSRMGRPSISPKQLKGYLLMYLDSGPERAPPLSTSHANDARTTRHPGFHASQRAQAHLRDLRLDGYYRVASANCATTGRPRFALAPRAPICEGRPRSGEGASTDGAWASQTYVCITLQGLKARPRGGAGPLTTTCDFQREPITPRHCYSRRASAKRADLTYSGLGTGDWSNPSHRR
jgi:hypothetical protein